MKNIIYINQAERNIKNKINITKIYKKQKIKGFTLVELMVAVTIGIIILLAASATFITTYKLNQEVKNRINYEVDIRNTADLLRSDVHQLASFGCEFGLTPVEIDTFLFEGPFVDEKNFQFISTTPLTDEEELVGVKATDGIKPLVITYVKEEYIQYIDANRCSPSSSRYPPETNASYYMVGTTKDNPVSGLYKINFTAPDTWGDDGVWSAPQLLVSNVKNMDFTFYYDKHKDSDCPKTKDDSSLAPSIEESNSGEILTEYKKPPILIKTTLTVCPTGDCNKQTINYDINAMSRKGEVCNYL